MSRTINLSVVFIVAILLTVTNTFALSCAPDPDRKTNFYCQFEFFEVVVIAEVVKTYQNGGLIEKVDLKVKEILKGKSKKEEKEELIEASLPLISMDLYEIREEVTLFLSQKDFDSKKVYVPVCSRILFRTNKEHFYWKDSEYVISKVEKCNKVKEYLNKKVIINGEEYKIRIKEDKEKEE